MNGVGELFQAAFWGMLDRLIQDFLLFLGKNMNKLITLILLMISPFSWAKLHFPDENTSDSIPERFIHGEQTFGYSSYDTRGEGFSVLDGREKDGKMVKIHYTPMFMGVIMIQSVKAKTWAEFEKNEYQINSQNHAIYVVNCANMTASHFETKQDIEISKLSGVEQAAAQIMCDLFNK